MNPDVAEVLWCGFLTSMFCLGSVELGSGHHVYDFKDDVFKWWVI